MKELITIFKYRGKLLKKQKEINKAYIEKITSLTNININKMDMRIIELKINRLKRDFNIICDELHKEVELW